MDLWWAYVLVGLVCGTFSATFGVGSGIILVPALVLIFSFPQKGAQGICLAAMVPMALAGALRYKLNPRIEVDMLAVGLISVGGVVGAMVGASLASWAPGAVLRKLFAIIMIVAATRMLLTPQSAKRLQNVQAHPQAAVEQVVPSQVNGQEVPPDSAPRKGDSHEGPG